MTLVGNAIPVAILRSQGEEELVSPAMDDWWQNLQPLRWASSTGRLFCPDCGGRLAFCAGTKIPTPYFKHLENSCVATGPGRGGVGGGGRAWDRHQLVVSLRQAFPAGTQIDCADYLFGRRSWLEITRPGERAFMLEVVTHPLDLAVWEERKAAARARNLSLFVLFTGDLIPPALLELGSGDTATTALRPEHDAVARPFKVDLAHAAVARHYGLDPEREVKGQPRSLSFVVPGRKREDTGAIGILRGILPDPAHVHTWYGRLVTAPMTGGGTGSLRFSLRHGFYTREDISTVRKLIAQRRAARGVAKQAAAEGVQPAVSPPTPTWSFGPVPSRSPRGPVLRLPSLPIGAPPSVSPVGPLDLTHTHRKEMAGRRTFFIPHSGRHACYVHPVADSRLAVTWGGRRYEGCGETTMGAADKEIRQYRR